MSTSDRRPFIVAGVVGVAAVGGVFLASHPPKPRNEIPVLDQHVGEARGFGEDLKIPSVLFKLDTNAAEAVGFSGGVEVVDRQGRHFTAYAQGDASGSQYAIPLGYASAPDGPIVNVAVQDKDIAGPKSYSAKLAPFPPAVDRPVNISRNAPVEFLWTRRRPNEPYYLALRAKTAIPADEWWQITILQTRHAAKLECRAVLLGAAPTVLSLPYANEALAARLQIVRYQAEPHKETAVFKGLHLEAKDGKPFLRESSLKWPPEQKEPMLYLSSFPNRTNRYKDGPDLRVDLSVPSPLPNMVLKPRTMVDVKLQKPSPEDLGLRAIEIGNGELIARTKSLKPLCQAPFDLVLLVRYTTGRLQGKEEVGLAIPPSPNPPGKVMGLPNNNPMTPAMAVTR